MVKEETEVVSFTEEDAGDGVGRSELLWSQGLREGLGVRWCLDAPSVGGPVRDEVLFNIYCLYLNQTSWSFCHDVF